MAGASGGSGSELGRLQTRVRSSFFLGAKRVCWVYTPMKTNMTTEDHHFLIGYICIYLYIYISSNGCLSVVMLVFRVVNEQ